MVLAGTSTASAAPAESLLGQAASLVGGASLSAAGPRMTGSSLLQETIVRAAHAKTRKRDALERMFFVMSVPAFRYKKQKRNLRKR
jgi:hypothetical protein